MTTPATLSVPARPEFARLMRAVADAIGAGADLPADTIDDLELAVTEAAGAMMADGVAERLRMEIDVHGSSVRCRIGADGGATPDVAPDAVRAMVLSAVTATHRVDAGTIEFTVSPD